MSETRAIHVVFQYGGGLFDIRRVIRGIYWQLKATETLQKCCGTVFYLLQEPRRVGRNHWITLLVDEKMAKSVTSMSNLEEIESTLKQTPSLKVVFIPFHVVSNDLLAIGEFAQRTDLNVVIIDCERPVPLARKIETCTREEFENHMDLFGPSKN